ncbi:GGDEF domain-containing protein [Campylobacter sputorum]|uniref:GGDEF domain-containing protein n=2 Tax=Campylobacter sputorum TaxID=206 RepID=UPI0018967143|nr:MULTISPECIES: GGDEF domain-containing protein [unclassified Campylobacter]MBF6674517.1 GGDEF domain-containing protein [Campylobacter sp. RM13538]MBF6675470.1 GGDEF domain-containing protein [Campylobacter sp. RM12321]
MSIFQNLQLEHIAMSTKLSEIIKESLFEIKSKHLLLTPDNYAQVFCEVSARYGVSTKDCQKLKKYVEKLGDQYSLEVKRLNVKTVDELFAFLISRLNMAKPTECAVIINAFSIFCKKILQSIILLGNKDARNLANATITTLERKTDQNTLNILSDKWRDFAASYDDSFFKKLEFHGISKPDDISKFVDDIDSLIVNLKQNSVDMKSIAELVLLSLVPSISNKKDETISILNKNIKQNPSSLSLPQVSKNIKSCVKRRIELDVEEISDKAIALNNILNTINSRLVNATKMSNDRSKNMKDIKKNLGSIDLANDNFDIIKQKLISIADALDLENEEFQIQMTSDQEIINSLKARVEELETKLSEAKKESNEDFLTKVATRRGLMQELSKFDEMYIRYGINYSVCFFDLDKFKNVNDIYGHDAGDLILSTFGSILKKYTREVDFVGRYGGEEFVLLLPNLDLKQAYIVAQKIRNIVSNFQFIYRDKKITITVSCGIASRSEHKNSQDLLDAADKLLYEAKNSGRNKVMPELNNEIK